MKCCACECRRTSVPINAIFFRGCTAARRGVQASAAEAADETRNDRRVRGVFIREEFIWEQCVRVNHEIRRSTRSRSLLRDNGVATSVSEWMESNRRHVGPAALDFPQNNQ